MAEFSRGHELLPFACPDHGDYYTGKAAGIAELQGLVVAGYDGDALDAYAAGNPRLQDALDTTLAIAGVSDAMGTVHAPAIRGVLTRTKTTEVAPLADRIATDFVTRLDRPPDLIDISAVVMEAASQVAFVRRGVARNVPPGIESGIVNELAALLLVRCDRDKLCHTPFPGSDPMQTEAALDAQADAVAAAFAARYAGVNPINPDFLKAKQRNFGSLVYMAYRLHDAMPNLPAMEFSEATLRELGKQNAELAKQIQRIRHYGVASVAFDTSELLPGTEAVYDEYSKTEMPNFMGEMPLAIINFVPADAPPDKKFNYMTSSYERSPELKIVVSAGLGALSVNHRGELFAGLSPQTNSIPLRDFFAAEGKEGEYEYMRAILLSNLFDAVAPATIVDSISDETRRMQSTTEPSAREPSDIVTRLVLPRIRYLSSRSMKDVKRAIAHAEETERASQESQRTSSGRRWHEVPAFLRPLPANAKGPSERAIARAKEHYGDDYELPPGYTYVKKHERGDLALGRVVGHVATTQAVHPDA